MERRAGTPKDAVPSKDSGKDTDLVKFTERQLEYLRLAGISSNTKQIADAVTVEDDSVQVMFRNIIQSLGVISRDQAVIYAVATKQILVRDILANVSSDVVNRFFLTSRGKKVLPFLLARTSEKKAREKLGNVNVKQIGYLLRKKYNITNIQTVLLAVQKGDTTYEEVLGNKKEKREFLTYKDLNDKEKEALALIAQGWSFKKIGEKCGISADTVNKRLENARRKTGMTSNSQMVLSFIVLGDLDAVVLTEDANVPAIDKCNREQFRLLNALLKGEGVEFSDAYLSKKTGRSISSIWEDLSEIYKMTDTRNKIHLAVAYYAAIIERMVSWSKVNSSIKLPPAFYLPRDHDGNPIVSDQESGTSGEHITIYQRGMRQDAS